MQTEEQRRFARLFINVPVTYLILPDGSVEQSVTRDVGGGGVCLFVDEPLQKEALLRVEIKLPEQGPSITFVGEVAWCQEYELVGKTTGGDVHQDRLIQTGLKFMQIDPEDRKTLLRYCQLSD